MVTKPRVHPVARLSVRRTFLVACLFVGTIAAPPADATMTGCSYQETEQTLDFFSVTPTATRLFVNPAGEFKWADPNSNGIFDCGGATVHNTDSVDIVDYNTSQDHLLILDFTRRFAPGATPEGSGKSEIEIAINGDGSGDGNDALHIWGGKRRDRITLGAGGIAVNGDGDRDITEVDYENFLVLGKGRRDRLGAQGGHGTGGPFARPTTLYGNGGPDVISGGTGIDRLFGSGGDDVVDGEAGMDIIFGHGGSDLLLGRGGGDELDGMRGPDRLRGHAGADDLEGGAGVDDCAGGGGADTISTCESGGD